MLSGSEKAVMLIGIGFFLMAGGVPISSLAMFGFLANTTKVMGWSWIFAAMFVSLFTVVGHAMFYVVFRQLGSPFRNRLVKRYPGILKAVSRIKLTRAQGKPSFDPAHFLLRWIGVGYSQVFWMLGLSGHDASLALRFLFLTDILWASVWSFGLTKLLVDAPVISRYLTRFSWVLLIAGVLGYGVKKFLVSKE